MCESYLIPGLSKCSVPRFPSVQLAVEFKRRSVGTLVQGRPINIHTHGARSRARSKSVSGAAPRTLSGDWCQ